MAKNNFAPIGVLILVILLVFGGFGMMGPGGMMGYGFGFGIGLLGWLFMILFVIAFVLFIVWLVKQIQEHK